MGYMQPRCRACAQLCPASSLLGCRMQAGKAAPTSPQPAGMQTLPAVTSSDWQPAHLLAFSMAAVLSAGCSESIQPTSRRKGTPYAESLSWRTSVG